ncbi:hypothetical protein CLOM_g10142 [Closterium sp. NIES-68]|nr:hypothetical protein CLOM_g10142 [Closterium sp. NIES-68]
MLSSFAANGSSPDTAISFHVSLSPCTNGIAPSGFTAYTCPTRAGCCPISITSIGAADSGSELEAPSSSDLLIASRSISKRSSSESSRSCCLCHPTLESGKSHDQSAAATSPCTRSLPLPFSFHDPVPPLKPHPLLPECFPPSPPFPPADTRCLLLLVLPLLPGPPPPFPLPPPPPPTPPLGSRAAGVPGAGAEPDAVRASGDGARSSVDSSTVCGSTPWFHSTLPA